MAFQTMTSFGIISIKRYFPIWAKVVNMFKTQAALDFRRQFFAFADNRIAERLSMETIRPDFMTFIMRNQEWHESQGDGILLEQFYGRWQ